MSGRVQLPVNGPLIALYRGTSTLSTIIKWRTWGDYSHASWITEEGREIEAWTKGMREVDFGEDHTPNTIVDLFVVEGMTPERSANITAALREMVARGVKYDYWALLGFIVRRKTASDSRAFCSEAIFEKVTASGIILLRRIAAYQVDPSTLGTTPLMHLAAQVRI